MRSPFVLATLGLALQLHAQTTWMPLSREVERAYAPLMHQTGSTMHTAIRPYRRSELKALDPKDSAVAASAVSALDRWAGVRNGRTFRWGPLLDLQGGFDADTTGEPIHRAGLGLWLEKDLGARWSLHVDGMSWHERLPAYLDSFTVATQTVAGEGIGYLPLALERSATYGHYDWNAYVSWDPGRYFNLTLGRGKNFFGEGHRSLILSDEATSYPFLKVTTTVWKVKYVNLFAAMNDIRDADGDPAHFNRKWSSMHYLSWNAHPRINVAVFEAIMWSQGDSRYPRGFDFNYLNPIIFYRPVEFNIGSPDNALLGGALNIKAGRNTLFYLQVMLDEFLLKQVRAGDGWYANKQAFQFGVVARDAFRQQGLTLRAEWNVVRPFMYTHSDTRQNYAHFGQPLAHPYGSNFQEVLGHAEWSRGRWLHGLRASMAWLGRDTDYSYGNNIFRPESDRRPGLVGVRDYGYRIGNEEPYTVLHAEARSGWLLDASTGTRAEAAVLFRSRALEGGETHQAVVLRAGIVCYFRDRHAEQEPRYVLR